MGGGGGGNIDTQGLMRRPAREWRNIHNWYGHQTNELNNYIGQDPIFSKLYPAAAHYFGMGPSSILSALQTQGLDYLKRGPSAATRALTNLGISTATGGPSRLTQGLERFGLDRLARPDLAASPLLRLMQGQSMEDLRNRGALTPELNRDVRNETLAAAGAMGMGYTPGTLGTELLNREKYREQREQLARQYATGTEQLGQSQEQLRQADVAARFGFAKGAQQAGIEDLSSRLAAGQIGQGAEIQDIASRFGIGGQVQGLTQADIAQRYAIPLSVASAAVSNFSGLTNPILAYLGNLFSGNQQASTQAALGNSQAGAANKAGQSSLAGAGIGAIGSIAGAVIL
jgi:hypothetical protein